MKLRTPEVKSAFREVNVPDSKIRTESRRRFLEFLAGSPLLAWPGLGALGADGPLAPSKLPDPIMWAPMRTEDLIASPKDAINVFDFEPVARKNVPPAHFGYMASGIDDEVTLRANREGFLKFQLRPRRLVDVSKVDMSTEILGVRYASPIIIAPVGGQKSFHQEGEIAAARGARDRSGGRTQEPFFRLQPPDRREGATCHDRSSLQASLKRRAMYEGVDVS